MHKICFAISFISCLYMFQAHVIIIRRSKLHYTASGIITHISDDLLMMSTCARNMKRHEIKLIAKQILCINLVIYWDAWSTKRQNTVTLSNTRSVHSETCNTVLHLYLLLQHSCPTEQGITDKPCVSSYNLSDTTFYPVTHTTSMILPGGTAAQYLHPQE